MTPSHRYPTRGAWIAPLLGAAAATGLLFLAYSARRSAPESIGFAEFRPPVPAGHPVDLTVRLDLPLDYRVSYAWAIPQAEAGVADARGERLFYVVVRLAPVQGAGGESLLQTFARQNGLGGNPDCLDVMAEFSTTARGPIWCQRYTEVFRNHGPTRPAQAAEDGSPVRLDVLRYAEEWKGLILELEFRLKPDHGPEVERLVWSIVRETVLGERPGP